MSAMKLGWIGAAVLASVLGAWGIHVTAQGQPPALTAEQRQSIDGAVPSRAPAAPKRPRKLLVVTLQMRNGAPTQGPSFATLPAQNYALEQMGKRTGAYEVVVSNDIQMFRPDRLAQFDAICFCNSLGVLFDDAELKKSLMDFVAGGKGIVGIHDAVATFVQWPQYDQWPEFGRMMGGTENGGHPWDGELAIKVDDAASPLTAMFGGQRFAIRDQPFQLQEPTIRDRLHVLMSIDVERMPAARRINAARAGDKDFPVSWLKRHGEGRVFFSSLGHSDFAFWNPKVLEHFLAGIQYALGDLAADDRPSTQ
jgi:type 1 glutamine amidotransferase